MNAEKLAKDYRLYEVIAGSHAYGMNLPSSDLDIRGIFAAPPEIAFSPYLGVGEHSEAQNDTTFYELAKFIKLLTDCNPNIIEFLWVEPRHIRYRHPAMRPLLEHRARFLTKRVQHTFSGYAMSQLNRLLGHEKWIRQQVEAAVRLRDLFAEGAVSQTWLRAHFDQRVVDAVMGETAGADIPVTAEMDALLADSTLAAIAVTPPRLLQYVRIVDEHGIELTGLDQMRALLRRLSATKLTAGVFKLWEDPSGRLKQGVLSEQATAVSSIDLGAKRLAEIGPLYRGMLLVNLDGYQRDHDRWKSYWDWKTHRNPARAALEEQRGYDTKHAAHLVRLLRMAHEILTEGVVHVWRADAQELLAIRHGEWELARLIDYAKQLEEDLKPVAERSSLPWGADLELATRIYFEMLREAFGLHWATPPNFQGA